MKDSLEQKCPYIPKFCFNFLLRYDVGIAVHMIYKLCTWGNTYTTLILGTCKCGETTRYNILALDLPYTKSCACNMHVTPNMPVT